MENFGQKQTGEESQNPYAEHQDVLSLSLAIAGQPYNEVDWKAVLEQVGVMRDPEGRPMEGANVLGATALQMISSASAVEAISRAGQEAAGNVMAATGRLEGSAGQITGDLNSANRKMENTAEAVGTAAGKVAARSEELEGTVRMLRPVADQLADTLSPYRLNQFSEASSNALRAATSQRY